MHIIEPDYEILTPISEGGISELKLIELAGRTCYKSESKISPEGNSAKTFVKRLIDNHHESVLEHSMLTVKWIVSRAVANEIVRHRHCSFSQESTRYCNYYNDGCIFVYHEDEDNRPLYIKEREQMLREISFSMLEDDYRLLIQQNGAVPENARYLLPLSLKTELVMTTNYREWRYFFKERTSKAAAPELRYVASILLEELKSKIPVVFEDL